MVRDQSSFSLFLFGAPRLERAGRFVPVRRRKLMALLAYLAVTGQTHTRDALATLLWPESDPQRAYASLRRSLSLAKETVGQECLAVTREMVGWQAAAPLWVDVIEFRRGLTAVQSHNHAPDELCPNCQTQLTRAAELYRGEFLAGFSLPDAPQFDEWQFWQAEALRQDMAWALEQLVAHHTARAQPEAAIACARRWAHLEPLCETAQQQLIRLYVEMGQPAAAGRQYRRFAQQLQQELGQTTSAELATLYRQIQTRVGVGTTADISANVNTRPFPLSPVSDRATQLARSGDRPDQPGRLPANSSDTAVPSPSRHNLPLPATPFVGREQALQQLAEWLHDPHCRLITITGFGGVGKTRLAMQVAREQAEDFADGVCFVSLETASSAEELVQAITQALPAFHFDQKAAKKHLIDLLRPRHLLLVLDNFEQLTAATPFLAELLAAAPGVKLLVTSRRRLNLQEEWLFPLEGLACPAAGDPAAASTAAVELFVQCARRQQPGFTLSPAELSHVIHICQQVAGLPLALELAAGWTRLLSCAEIAAEMSRNPAFLVTSCSNVPERHHSLQAVCDHTWQLLPPAEQQLARQLAIFCGGFERPAAAAVAGATLPGLRHLADQSLLRCAWPDGEEQRNGGSNGRFQMHPVIQQYAAARLAEFPGEQQAAQARHAHYYLDFLAQREAALQDRRQAGALAQIRADLDNVRAAWHWAIRNGDFQAIDRALAAFSLFYELKGFFWQGVADFEPEKMGHGCTRVNTDRFCDRVVGRLLVRQGRFYLRLSRAAEAEEKLRRGLALLGSADEKVAYDVALAQSGLGGVALSHNQSQTARSHYQACLATFRELGKQFHVARALTDLGSVACQLGDLDEAEQLDGEALALYREMGNPLGVATCLNNLSHLAEMAGDYPQAEMWLQQSLATARAMGSHWLTAVALANLGHIYCLQNQRREAKRYYQESLELRQQHRLPGIEVTQQALAALPCNN